MSNLHLELSFTKNEGGIVPSPAVARIYVKWSGGFSGDPLRYISQDCMTASELDFVVDGLQKELENIRAKGRASFAAERKG